MDYASCCGPGFRGRMYYTQQERRERLESYQEELENELKAVKERLKELKET